jgi:hypothetical protein
VVLLSGIAYWSGGFPSVGWTMVYFAAASLTSVLVYLGCGMVWLGLDGGLSLLALRVTAAVSASYIMAYASGFLMYVFACLGYFSMILPLLTYAVMLWELCELDLQDGIIVALLTAGGVAAVLFSLAAALN